MRLERGMEAPHFTATDFQGRGVVLRRFRGERNVLLVFNRGFT